MGDSGRRWGKRKSIRPNPSDPYRERVERGIRVGIKSIFTRLSSKQMELLMWVVMLVFLGVLVALAALATLIGFFIDVGTR